MEDRVNLLALWMCGASSAADPIELPEEEEIDVPSEQPTPPSKDGWPKPPNRLTAAIDDDETMHDFAADEKKKAPPPAWFHLDPTGKVPLADNFAIQIDAFNEQYVVVELPLLVASDRESFLASSPSGLQIVAEVTSGSLRQVITAQVTPDLVFEAAPTLVFLKTAIPNSAKTGDIRYLVKAGKLPPLPPPADPRARTPPPPPPAPAPPRDLFARTTVYRRP